MSTRSPWDGFDWRPGLGADAQALHRLGREFRRPSELMGEAWFMGDDRRMYPELRGDLDQLSTDQLRGVLYEIASGTSCFGPMREWTEWFHFLLPSLVRRGHEHHGFSLLESMISAFVALYPTGVYHENYAGFRSDVMHTLGRVIMAPECWQGQQVRVGRFLHRSNNNPRGAWRWWEASGDFSASLCFCLKYLPPYCVAGWFRSVLAIESPHWRAQLIVWLVGANDLLRGRILWPSEFDPEAYPAIAWEGSHVLRPDLSGTHGSGATAVHAFLPAAACDAVLKVVLAHFTGTVFIEWLTSIGTVPILKSELAEIPSAFEALYVDRGIVTTGG